MSIKKSKLTYVSLAAFFVFSISSSIVLSNTIDGKLDYFSYQLNNYNKSNYETGFTNPIISIEKDDTFIHNSLLRNFYYNFMVGGCRQMVNENISFAFQDNYEIDATCVGQDVFAITGKVAENEYIIERNMYHSYYYKEIFEDGNNHTARFGSNSFIFVSDIMADEIVSHYNLSSFDDPYKEIISNENYSFVELVVNGERTGFNFSINNIIHSTKKQAIRTSNLYGNFVLAYFTNAMNKYCTSRFEIDLKVDPYGNKTIFKTINELDYNISNSHFSFYKYDQKNKTYSFSKSLSDQYEKIWSQNNDTLLLIISVFLGMTGLISYVVLYFFISKQKIGKHEFICFAIENGSFVIYGIIGAFIYIYPWGSVFPILYFLISFLWVKGIIQYFKERKIRAKNETTFIEIKI